MNDAAFATLRQRALLRHAARLPSAADLLEWAALCRTEGQDLSADALARVAALRRGFSAELLAERAGEGFGRRRNLVAQGADGSGTVAIAITELEAFGRDWSAPLAEAVTAAAPNDETMPHRARAGHAAAEPPADVLAAIETLHAGLASEDGDAGTIDMLLGRLSGAVRRLPDFDYRLLSGAPLPLLAAGLAFAGLQAFVTEDSDLLFAPFGSAALWHRTARFSSWGLGPGFDNVQRIVRRSRDLFELAARGAEAGGGMLPVEIWVGLLARRLSGALLHEVVDDIGDRDLRRALAMILAHRAAQPLDTVDRPLLMRLRDIGLDNRDYDLAFRAQRHLLDAGGDDRLNQVILGSIAATAGQVTVAEEVFERCLEDEPNDADVLDRLAAVRAHRFERYAVLRGYGSPEDRQLYRLHQRGRKPAPKRTGGPSLAVELNYSMEPRR